MENIPDEITQNILLNADISDLDSLCQVNNQYRNICNDTVFWKNKGVYDLGNKFTPSLFNLSPKLNYYIQMGLNDGVKTKEKLNKIRTYYDIYTFTKLIANTEATQSSYYNNNIDSLLINSLLYNASIFKVLRYIRGYFYNKCFTAIIKFDDFVKFLTENNLLGSNLLDVLNNMFSSFYFKGDLIYIVHNKKVEYYIFNGKKFKSITDIYRLDLTDFYDDIPEKFPVNYWYIPNPNIYMSSTIIWFYPEISILFNKIYESTSYIQTNMIRIKRTPLNYIYTIYLDSLKSNVLLIFNIYSSISEQLNSLLQYGIYQPTDSGLQLLNI